MLDGLSCFYFDWATVGTWVGGIGSAGAAIAAVKIAHRSDQAREVEKANALEIYQILVAPEITTFASALPGIRAHLIKESEGLSVIWINVCAHPIYSSLLDGVPEMEKHAEMLRLLPIKEGRDFAMIAMLCADLSRKLNQSLERERFIEPPAAVVKRIDLLIKYLSHFCRTQEVDVSAIGEGAVESLHRVKP